MLPFYYLSPHHHYYRMYNQMWAGAHLELSNLLKEELPAEPSLPEMDRVVFFQRLALLYVRYLKLFRQLQKVYDQLVHPQKRRLIRAILDGVTGRVLELKNEMVEAEFSEYHYLDDVLHDMKLTPVSVKLHHKICGRHFVTENAYQLWQKFNSDFHTICSIYCHSRQTLRSPSLAISSVSKAKNSGSKK